ncbi:CD276 antigen-like [Gadus chalcogrammus]|uniref:CD276 antigen-like n=1 Tax=Gadus chalcogrammus TaxID=1042646 RepID=UPI0024C4D9EF|nr:CD276 antigen-like [Gadus chalcogrammus]
MAELSGVLVRTAVFLIVEVLVQGGAVQSPDTKVGCVFGGSCVLPCRFQPNGDTILHWVKMNGKEVKVHRYSRDQDKDQDPLYEERTSLFHDQISGGNASLSLARVNLQDQGRYLCYTSTSQNDWMTSVTLTVRAPVARVDIMLVNNNVTCQSGGIYPRPHLTWSVSPRPSTVLQNTTEVHEDDRGLYDISGSLRTVYNDTESTYSCSVQNEHSAKKAMMRPLPPMQSAPKSEVLLPCDASGLDDITWTFNHNQTILRRQAGQEKVVETEWQQHVRDLSESGSLLLYVTSSAQSEGAYRCTLRYADEEDVTHIELKILEDPVAEGSHLTLPMLQILMVFLTISPLILWLCIHRIEQSLFQFFFFGFIFIVFLLFCCCNAQLIASLI